MVSSAFADKAREFRPGTVAAVLSSLWPVALAVLAALGLQFYVKPLMGDFTAKILLDIGTNVILAVSLTMVNGFTGQFSMGHAAFMLVGGYTAAIIVYYGSMYAFGDADVHGGRLSTMIDGREGPDGPLPFATWADLMFLGAVLAGGLVAAGCGYLVGLPSLRLKGDYLAIVTLGFGEIVRVLVQSQTQDVLYTAEDARAAPLYVLPLKVGGALGFSGLPAYANLFWAWLLAFGTLIFAVRLKRSGLGRAFLSIREDEVAAEAMGINTTKYKVRAFVIAAFFGGVAGGIFAHTLGVALNPGELGFMKSFDIIIMVVLGGMGSISGAALAAAILSILPELLRDPPGLWPWGWVVAAVLAVAFAVALPPGRKWKIPCVIVGIAAGWELMRVAAKTAGVNLAEYRMVIYALMLIVMMIARPDGLLGVRELWERGLWVGVFGRRKKGRAA